MIGYCIKRPGGFFVFHNETEGIVILTIKLLKCKGLCGKIMWNYSPSRCVPFDNG